MPAVKTPSFDCLVVGDGYQNVPAPTDDAASVPALSFAVPDSHNTALTMKSMSLATETEKAPTNEWNTWNSGAPATD